MTGSRALGAGTSLAGSDDTIVAVATPPGRGALAVVRLSGRAAHDIGRAMVERWPGSARTAVHSVVRDAAGDPLDDAVVVRYDAPASYTGEDAFEITSHGGAVVPATIAAAAIELGARHALPGEFTRRAVFNGKLDLLQAEAAGDLVAATSRAAQRVALGQLDGALSRRITELRARLIEVEALLAYDIDFPEEDAGPLPPARILSALDATERSLEALLRTTRAGELVREGALVVLAGVPNAGKSSLFNAMLGQARAIVTDIPGTTRDAIEAVLDVGRWPLRLVDTAGLRDSSDPVERLGVEISVRYAGRAAVVLACGETVVDIAAAAAVASAAHENGVRAPVLLVNTKADIQPLSAGELEALRSRIGAAAAVHVSAVDGTGLTELIAQVMSILDSSAGTIELDAPLLTHARHRQAIARARDELAGFRRAWHAEGLPATVAAVHLRTAVGALEDMIGSVDVEQILDELFSRFCIGK